MMFESVVLPAPFSPSSACTSPTAASKATRSFASTPGKRFVMPRSSTAAALAAGGASGGARNSPRTAQKPTSLALGAPDDALHEPVHRVQVLDRQALPLLHAQLALLVVQRPSELVELAR